MTGVNKESDSLSRASLTPTLCSSTLDYFFTTTSVDPICPTASQPCRGLQRNSSSKTPTATYSMEYFLNIPGATVVPDRVVTGAADFPWLPRLYHLLKPQAVHVGSQPITNLHNP